MSKHHTQMWIVFLTSVIVFLMHGCSSKSDVSDNTAVATWGDTTVTVDDFKQKMYVRYRNEPTARKKTFDERMDVLMEYVERDLKLAEALRLGYDEREDIRKRYDEAVERKATEILYNRMVRDRILKEDMVRNFFENDQYEVRARHILIKMEPEVKGQDTVEYWDRIWDVYQQAKAGQDFERLVDRYSEDDTIDRSLHGDLGYFKWGRMVDAFQEAAWALDPGEVSEPVRTRYGYHIIKLIDKRPRGLEVNTSHILVKCNRRADKAETTLAFDRAMMILKEARKKGADFAQLARRYSEDDRTWVNGVVGYIPRGSMPSDYWDACWDMKEGEIKGPVRSYKGYHIIMMNERRVVKPSLDDPDERNRVLASMSRVYRDTLQSAAEFFLDSLVQAMDAEYNEEVIQMMLEKLNDPMAPANMNRFGLFTAEEREMNVLDDKTGGIKIEDLVQRFGDNQFQPDYRDDREFIVEMVEQLTVPKYLGHIAKKRGLLDHPEALEEGRRVLDNAMLPEIEQEMVFNKATPTEDELREYYEKNQEKFIQGETATVYEIMLDDRAQALDLFSRVQRGEDISALARKYTQRRTTKHKGGLLEDFTRDQYGKVSREAFELEPGEIAGPIKVGPMYSIVKMVSKAPERRQTFEEARQQIESDLRFRKQKETKEAWIEELKKRYNLVVHEDVVRNVWPIIEPLPETMVEERKQWYNERKERGQLSKRKREEEAKIQMKLKPGTTQTFMRDGKEIKVKIGEPRVVKDGEKTDGKSNLKVTKKGGTIELTPKGQGE